MKNWESAKTALGSEIETIAVEIHSTTFFITFGNWDSSPEFLLRGISFPKYLLVYLIKNRSDSAYHNLIYFI